MIRTLVTLDEAEYELAKKEATALGISVAEFVRRSIRQNLPAAVDKTWMRYVGWLRLKIRSPARANPLMTWSMASRIEAYVDTAAFQNSQVLLW
jgi:hypothetical protein